MLPVLFVKVEVFDFEAVLFKVEFIHVLWIAGFGCVCRSTFGFRWRRTQAYLDFGRLTGIQNGSRGLDAIPVWSSRVYLKRDALLCGILDDEFDTLVAHMLLELDSFGRVQAEAAMRWRRVVLCRRNVLKRHGVCDTGRGGFFLFFFSFCFVLFLDECYYIRVQG